MFNTRKSFLLNVLKKFEELLKNEVKDFGEIKEEKFPIGIKNAIAR